MNNPNHMTGGCSPDLLLADIERHSPLLGTLMQEIMRTDFQTLQSDCSWYAFNKLSEMFLPPSDPLLQHLRLASLSPQAARQFISDTPTILEALNVCASQRLPPAQSTAPPLTCNPDDSLTVITWNVRGLHSKT